MSSQCRLRRERAWAIVAVLFGVACAACGSAQPSGNHNTSNSGDGGTPSATGSPTAAGGTAPGSVSSPTAAAASAYTVQVTLTGKDVVSGTFAASAASGCAIPRDLSGDVAGHHFDLQVNSAGQPDQQAQLSPGDVVLVIDSDNWAVGSSANAPQGTTGTLQRNSNGSGSLAFQNLYLQSQPAHVPQESGSITWTCA